MFINYKIEQYVIAHLNLSTASFTHMCYHTCFKFHENLLKGFGDHGAENHHYPLLCWSLIQQLVIPYKPW